MRHHLCSVPTVLLDDSAAAPPHHLCVADEYRCCRRGPHRTGDPCYGAHEMLFEAPFLDRIPSIRALTGAGSEIDLLVVDR
jgi:hypothetical protein